MVNLQLRNYGDLICNFDEWLECRASRETNNTTFRLSIGRGRDGRKISGVTNFRSESALATELI